MNSPQSILSKLAILRDLSWWSIIWRKRGDKAKLVIVRTKTVPLLSGFVRPLLKMPEGGDGDDARKTFLQSLKLFQHRHRRLVVSRHTVALDGLKKGRTDAVRVAVVVLRGAEVGGGYVLWAFRAAVS